MINVINTNNTDIFRTYHTEKSKYSYVFLSKLFQFEIILQITNNYSVEWILIVNMIHRNCDVGISFKYDEILNIFITTAIYLDKGEIESKHKLIGLKFDYCKNIKPFSLRKFKFKSNRHSIIDDDDDVRIIV